MGISSEILRLFAELSTVITRACRDAISFRTLPAPVLLHGLFFLDQVQALQSQILKCFLTSRALSSKVCQLPHSLRHEVSGHSPAGQAPARPNTLITVETKYSGKSSYGIPVRIRNGTLLYYIGCPSVRPGLRYRRGAYV